jgi:hypothetical protein
VLVGFCPWSGADGDYVAFEGTPAESRRLKAWVVERWKLKPLRPKSISGHSRPTIS